MKNTFGKLNILVICSVVILTYLLSVSGCTNIYKGLFTKDHQHVQSTTKSNSSQFKQDIESKSTTESENTNDQHGIVIENSGNVKVHSKDNVKVQVKDSPVNITFNVDPFHSQYIMKILSTIESSGDETSKKQTSLLLKNLIYAGLSSIQSPGLLNTLNTGASSPNMSHEIINSIKQIDLNAISIKKDQNGFKISNPGNISVGTNDDIDISVINSSITINFLLGNSYAHQSDISNAQPQPLSHTKKDFLTQKEGGAKKESKPIDFSFIPISKTSCIGNQACLGKILHAPFQLFGMIKQMWTAGDKKENENTTVIKNSLPSTAISDSSTLPFGLIKTLVGGISIKNEGQVDVISQDKVNVRLINSPIHINFTY